MIHTPVRRRRPPAPAPEPAPTYTQAELRERRRKHLSIAYMGNFDLSREITDICSPLAGAVAARPNPAYYMPEIEELAEAVGEVMHVVAGLLAERDAWRKVREANVPLSRRAPAVRMIIDLAKRPPPPRPTEAGVASGAWVVTMARHVKPFSSDLADLLGHAWPPGADALRGAPSVSERVEKALRIVDAAALRLQRRLDRAAQTDSDRSTHQATDTDPAEQARRELAALGIELDDEMQEATP